MGKSRFSSDEAKMVGTVSNKLKAMSDKERLKRRRLRLEQMTEGEKKIMQKYGKSWDTEYRSTFYD
jgi:hypothetical protein|tara:strand:- start:1832 stop:2029 length:198 start_codon:yes stop_codon:yes gene_type:complete